MPTEQVIEKLVRLQQELDTISSAVKHIDEAAKVAKTASYFMKLIPDLINDLKVLEEKHRVDLLKVHKEKIEILEKQLQTLLADLKVLEEKHRVDLLKVHKEKIEILEKQLQTLLADLKVLEEKHRVDLLKVHKEKIEILEKQLQSLLADLNANKYHIEQLLNKIEKLEKVILNYLEEIRKVNFPERLDKIDNQISAINIGIGNLHTSIQNVQGKTDTIQTSIGSLSQRIEKRFIEIDAKIKSENAVLKDGIKTNRIILIIGVSIIILIIMYLAIK